MVSNNLLIILELTIIEELTNIFTSTSTEFDIDHLGRGFVPVSCNMCKEKQRFLVVLAKCSFGNNRCN